MLISRFSQTKGGRQRKSVSSRAEKEIIHFRELLEKRKGLSWLDYATFAGRTRIKRRGKIAKEYITCGARVLELGSGLGELTRELAKTGAQITGLEITPELVRKAKERFKARNVLFKQGDAHNLSFKSGTFDFVVGNAILHHLDLEKALLEIKRVLKKKGKIIFFEPNLANPQIFLQKKIKFFRRISGDSPEETAFYRQSIKKALEKAHFENIKVCSFDFLHPLTPRVLVGLVRKLEPFLEKTPVLKEFSGSLLIYAEVNKPGIVEIRKFWDQNPLYSTEVKEKLGSKEFFRKIDEIKKSEVDRWTSHFYQFSKSRGKKVLDVGCGPGSSTRAYARSEAKVTAIDLSPVAVKLTRDSLKIFDLKGKVQIANIQKLPFSDETFDQVVASGVIHHTPCPEKAIAEISRVCKKGGRVMIAVYFLNFWLNPFVFPLTRLVLKLMAVRPAGKDKLTTAFSAKEFIRRYDGNQNPLAWALEKSEWIEMINRYFEIEKIEPHFFPKRFIFREKRISDFWLRFLDHHFGTMLYFSLIKPPKLRKMI